MPVLRFFSFYFFLLAALAGLVHGCDFINPAEEQPVYVRIDSFSFLPPVDGQNTVGLTSQIESVFVSYEGQTIGTFDLPALIPVLPGSGGLLTVRPGVDNTGMNGVQLNYPYYRSDTLRLSAGDVGQTLVFQPKTRYFDSLNYSFRADFELINNPFNSFLKLSGDTGLVSSDNAAYRIDGARVGLIVVDGVHDSSEVISQSVFIPTSAQPYIEIDYRCNIQFKIAVQSVDANIFDGYLTGVKANPAGAKLYIGIENFVANSPSASGFRIQLKTALPSGESSGFVAIDNLKVVSF